MKGYLVVNQFLHSGKFHELYEWFSNAAAERGISLFVKTNAELMPCLMNEPDENEFQDVDFILFWDKDIRLAKYLENCGCHVYNSASAIETCDDKSLTHLVLAKNGIPMPKTCIAPMTYENIGYTDVAFLDKVIEKLGLPMVVKECFGSFGQQVYLCHTKEEILDKMTRTVIFQEFIESSKGRDIRLQVVGDRVITGMYRYSENGDFRANITNGGKMKPYQWSKEEEELALACVHAIGLDFAGVDILFGENQKPIICEVNSNAHFKNIYDCTGVNTAEAILDYILYKEEKKHK